ncbi:MAG: hypothetical protein QF464_21185, partial [Myxococcota bacterium]|nr:hypothetical protein [Myxococcota bacterium]
MTGGSNTYLGGPSDQAVIFDPATGELTGPFTMGPVDQQGNPQGEPRGAHTMVYIPPFEGAGSGHVLVIGGMTKLRLDTKRAFPFVLGNDKSSVLNDVLLYDIDANTWDDLPGEIMNSKRAFAQAGLMSDGTVIITGGGGWPSESSDDYRQVEVFDPLKEGGAGFLPITSFEGEVARAGHSMTFLKKDENGQSHFLLWGGTMDVANAAEVLRQSSQQREGVDGSFAAVAEGGNESPFSTFFHQLTPLGDNRFLLTGGVTERTESEEDDGDLGLARDDEAWVLTYSEEPTPALTILRAPGFGGGRVFHTAGSTDGRHVSVVGGFNTTACGDGCFDLSTITDNSIRFYDDGASEEQWSDAADSDAFTVRGENVYPSEIDAVLNELTDYGGEHRIIISREGAMDELLVQ